MTPPRNLHITPVQVLALMAGLAGVCAQAARADGSGVLVGENARLHLGIEVEPRYDSLAGQGGIGQTDQPVFDPGEVILHTRPSLHLLAPSPTVDFEARAKLDWTYYTGILNPQTQELSFIGAELGAGLLLGKTGPFSLQLDDTFTRSDQTTNPALGLGTLTNANNLRSRLSARPGGGAIEGGAGYTFALEAYELNAAANIGCSQPSCDGTKYNAFGSQTHTFLLDSRWRFLPKTALIFEATETLRLYDNQTANVPVYPLRIQGGLAGLLTEKVRIVLKGGYINLFASRGESFTGWTGQAELAFSPSPTAGIVLSGLRTVEPVSDVYGWYEDWRLVLSGKLLVAGRLSMSVEGRLDRLAFNGGRIDTQATLDAQLALELRRELNITVGTLLTSHQSTEDPVFTYARAEIFLRLTVAY